MMAARKMRRKKMPKPMWRNNGFTKPYTIAMIGDNDAEINLYGEVVQSHPTDWWTGEKIPGNFIALDEFLKDLEELNTKDNITVHINSVGGDFYAGLAIYNRLRSLKASITTINDGLAASAGSIIFMAGDKGKRKAYAGSNLMVHGVLSFMYGYYNTADLRAQIKELDAHNKALIATYVEATGLDQDTVKSAISKDTYMTGQEAVDLGWADEVISGEGEGLVNMKLSPDRSCLMSNGMAVAARCFGKLPDSIPQMSAEEWTAMFTTTNKAGEPPVNTSMQPAPQDSINNNPNGGNTMEIKSVDEMRAAYPDYVAQVETAARNEAIQAERARIQGIESIQSAIGDAEMVRNAKFGEKPQTAQELALAAMQKQANLGVNMLNALEGDTKNGGAEGVKGAAAPANGADPDSPEAIKAQAKADVARFNNMKEVK